MSEWVLLFIIEIVTLVLIKYFKIVSLFIKGSYFPAMFFRRRYILLAASKVTAGAIISENVLVIFQLRNLVSADDARDMMITVWSRRYPKTSSLFGMRSPSGMSKTIGNVSNRVIAFLYIAYQNSFLWDYY